MVTKKYTNLVAEQRALDVVFPPHCRLPTAHSRLITAYCLLVSTSLIGGENSLAWKQTGSMQAPEASQAAAVDDESVYAITNTKVAKYDRVSGKRIAVSTGDAKHLNSGFWWNGMLYCAHSNYPEMPQRSEIKVLNPDTMQLSTFKDFGAYAGSLTWSVRDSNYWWCNFARYGTQNSKTVLVQFDTDWDEVARFNYPAELISELGQFSLSGGIWRAGLLHVTGHDDPVLFRLRLPTDGDILDYVDKQSCPFTGQGIAQDLRTSGIVGINRARREVLFARLEFPAASPRLDRENLLVYRSSQNQHLPVKTTDHWSHRRAEIVGGMRTIMGPLPGVEKQCALEMTVEEEVDCESYVRRLISYESEPGSRVPAYLCIPKAALRPGSQPAPAVLCLHGTDNVVGHGVVVGLGNRPNRQYASELAERGYVTLAPNYPLLAKYRPDLQALGWESGTLKAVWDNKRGLDLLETLPFVRSKRFGAIGHSLGGHNAVYTSVFDDRIQVVVSSCGLDSFLDYMGGDDRRWLPNAGWTQPLYMPRLAEYRNRLQEIPFDFHELIGALAPRHVLIIAPVSDNNFRYASVDRIATAARHVYKLYDQPDRLRVMHPDCGHDFPIEMREAAYQLFDENLR